MNTQNPAAEQITVSPVHLTEALTEIGDVSRQLATKNKEAEQHFLHLGEELQRLYTETVSLTQSADRAVKTVSSDNNISAIIKDISDQILSRFNGVKSVNMEILSQAQQVSARLSQLAVEVPEIRKIDKQLWILGSNMAVQSSGNPHTQQLFGEYSEDLKKFSKSIKGIILDFVEDLGGMNESVQQVQSSIRSETQRLDELITDSKNNIADATQQLEALLADSAMKIGVIEERSKDMSAGVADIVTSIQFNDITRQQIEHVIEGLDELSPAGTPFEVYKSMRVQSAQLELVVNTLHNAVQTISSAFDNIVSCGTEIASQYSASHSRRGSSDTPFLKIKTALQELEYLLELSAKLRAKSTHSLESATIASIRLSSHLEKMTEITGDLNLQAINALVMSRNIGQGGASLVALSKEVHSLSKESTVTVDGVIRALKQVGTLTAELRTTMDDVEEIDNSNQIKDGFDTIDEIAVAYGESIGQTSTLASQLKQNANQISSASAFIENLADAIEKDKRQLNHSAEVLSAHVEGDSDLDTDFRKRYTMESERLIHDRVEQELSGTLVDTEKDQPTVVDVEDDEFGDFELF